MRTHMASERRRVLIWALAFECMLMVQCARTQYPEDGFINFHCEMLSVEKCAFAVSAGGFRCVLETALQIDGSITYQCQTLRFQLQLGSDIKQSTLLPYIETDDCINACGLQRMTVGISTADEFSEHSLLEKLCSPKCKQNCGNIIDHYEIVMADEGKDLSSVCEYLTEYLNAERESEAQFTRTNWARNGDRSRGDSRGPPSSSKHHQILYEQAPGPRSDRAASPNSDR